MTTAGVSGELIVETDMGHDPDDFFAVCYLAAAGVNIRAILIVPGDPDQVAIARFLCKELGLDIPIGASKKDRTKLSSGSAHYDLLEKYGYSKEEKPDGLGVDILENIVPQYPDAELFVIGPVSSIGAYLQRHPETHFRRATMQGGFLPNHLHQFTPPSLPQFEGKSWMPTFNLNGDRKATMTFIDANIDEHLWVGKNVCHGVIFNQDRHAQYAGPSSSDPVRVRASELFQEAGEFYLARHEEKKFHDPTAAACHLHPEIGGWVPAKPVKMETGWGAELVETGHYSLGSVDMEQLWSHISERT